MAHVRASQEASLYYGGKRVTVVEGQEYSGAFGEYLRQTMPDLVEVLKVSDQIIQAEAEAAVAAEAARAESARRAVAHAEAVAEAAAERAVDLAERAAATAATVAAQLAAADDDSVADSDEE
jgi:hypothetical protein